MQSVSQAELDIIERSTTCAQVRSILNAILTISEALLAQHPRPAPTSSQRGKWLTEPAMLVAVVLISRHVHIHDISEPARQVTAAM